MRPYILLHLSWLILLLSSCITEVEFEAEDTEPQLIVNAIAETGEQLSVEVTCSKAVFSATGSDSYFPPVSDAVVTLSVNGKSERLTYNRASGSYVSATVIQPADSLNLTVSSGRKTARASIRVIDRAVEIQKTEITTDSTGGKYSYHITSGGDSIAYAWHSYVKADLTFDDPATQHNYYLARYSYLLYSTKVLMQLPDTTQYTDWFTWEQITDNEYTDIGDIGLSDLFSDIDDRIKEDGVYNGKSITAYSHTELYLYPDEIRSTIRIDSLTANYTLFCIDRHLNLYLKTAYSNQMSDGMSDMFSEPVQVYSNIDGGMGIFASMTKSKVHKRIQ